MTKSEVMFESLGYERKYDVPHYMIGYKNESSFIIFNTIFKEVFIHEQRYDGTYIRSKLSIDLHLAINQLMKELEWIK